MSGLSLETCTSNLKSAALTVSNWSDWPIRCAQTHARTHTHTHTNTHTHTHIVGKQYLRHSVSSLGGDNKYYRNVFVFVLYHILCILPNCLNFLDFFFRFLRLFRLPFLLFRFLLRFRLFLLLFLFRLLDLRRFNFFLLFFLPRPLLRQIHDSQKESNSIRVLAAKRT